MMKSFLLAFVSLLLLASHSALGAHDLSEEYRFSADLDPSYKLHWSFDLQAGTIAFAVNVSTTGWVGFGLSPNGQMPGSDVVIGWVRRNGQVSFKDRFAIDRLQTPPVDPSQDWFLVSGEEENGYTVLEFTRNLTSCDVNDLNIEADTSRVIWAHHPRDPTNENAIPRHSAMGSASLNLLGGLTVDRVEPDAADFSVLVDNVTIPAVDTTYWCEVHMLPTEIQEQERYVYKISPVISEVSSSYVHHIVIYLCAGLNNTFVGASGVCVDTHLAIQSCRGSEIIAAWAVGGTDFVFPPDVALPLGGIESTHRIVLIEMHYDNPTLQSEVVDTSGMRFTYTSTPPVHLAGAIGLGFPFTPGLIVPPGTPDFTITTFCSRECTQAHLPPEGITVFGNLLHTHLAGHGLVLEHIRETECGLREELEPIDENRRYDFNYQQATILPKAKTILPGDEIKLECFYGTSDYNEVTLGGESTREEMCSTFIYYYPRTSLAYCSSFPDTPAYQQFAMRHLDSSMHAGFIQSVATSDYDSARSILSTIDWTQEAIDTLQSIYLDTPQHSLCNDVNGYLFTARDEIPSADCSYVAPNTCRGKPGSQPGGCCRGTSTPPGSSATKLGQFSIVVVLVIASLLIISF